MTERARFVLAYEDGLYSMSELCQRFSISRKTGYKWLHRYQEAGLETLQDRSRAPQSCPHRTSAEIEDLLLKTRRKHPAWGPRKLIAYLARRYPQLQLPAPSTLGAMLKRNGLIAPRRRRRKPRHPGAVPRQVKVPNQVWSADFKGEFRMQNGIYCYPLTVSDSYSRYVLGCQGLLSTKQEKAFPVFEGLFKEYGLPEAIRTDNGNPFATQALCGLSKLNVWWIKIGIAHQRIEPGQPQQNGRHEWMHRTLKKETTRPPERNLQAQQRRFEAFRQEYNQERPHEALNDEVPASHYRKSQREMPSCLPEPAYPGHYEVRYVSMAGTFRFQKRQLFISQALRQEWIALEEIEDASGVCTFMTYSWAGWTSGITGSDHREVLPMYPV